MPGDELVLMGCQVLRELAADILLAASIETDAAAKSALQCSATQVVLEALAVLSRAELASPSNAQIKILLLKLYGWLGSVTPVTDLFNGIRAKHIQVCVCLKDRPHPTSHLTSRPSCGPLMSPPHTHTCTRPSTVVFHSLASPLLAPAWRG
jgi:hypothetical protein